MWERESLCESEVGEFEFQGLLMIGTQGCEVGEIGGFPESDLKREGEIGGSPDGLSDPILLRSHEERGEIEQVGFGRGEFEIGNEGIDKGEGFAAGGFLGSGIGIEEKEIGTAGKPPGCAEAGLDPELAGGEIYRDQMGLFALAG